ncbi:MAG: hypothetical protein GY762_16390 [Proteobacteria bacterium]|nr:hypothetical protein [Pseudomonadota bacterium]
MHTKQYIMGVLIFLLFCLCAGCTEDNGWMTECTVDTSKTGYELAEEHDDCLVWEAQKSTAHIDSTVIEIRATEKILTEFGSSYAGLNAKKGFVEAFYTFLSEDMSAYPDAPASIDGVVATKMKSKAAVDLAFERQSNATQGLCADVQKTVYETVLQSILTPAEREEYETKGLSLSFIPDDDMPPLGPDTNPVDQGQFWLPVDPASMITSDANGYYYEPISLLFDLDHPNADSVDVGLVGVRYCKLLTHQAILSWMRSKSFESEPVLITAAEDKPCTRPQRVETTAGSCVFKFGITGYYYCTDYVGVDHDTASAQELCSTDSRIDNEYDEKPCNERTAEIEAIPNYEGLVGACIIRCGGGDEFLWNVYSEPLAEKCVGYPYVTAEELADLAAE